VVEYPTGFHVLGPLFGLLLLMGLALLFLFALVKLSGRLRRRENGY